ncbi:2-dehydropantoate 2-reductase [Rhodoligotrophos appendicifer]|uniref:ketopantoate reductase family protein n=1 Tax=Rhodoligotrophos appendicifer TaxID=987056 RepID=UPI001186C6E0|nr:2-dehydropantoate 2-reductase [Rhodoligotrophos appendicifer]
MKFCIIGAGAIGIFLSAHLARRGHEITVLARGARAAAIREKGVTLTADKGDGFSFRPQVAESGEALAPQDVVLVCVKGYSVPDIAATLQPLMQGTTQAVFVQNGLPWWYFGETGSQSLDPGGRIAAAVPLERTIGCVTYANVRNSGLGEAHHVSDNTFILGRPDGHSDPALGAIIEALAEAGIGARISDRIRTEIWLKLWGNLAFNPLSALTGATMDEIIERETRPLVIAMMTEARDVAASQGIVFETSLEKRLATALLAGKFRTSMLQDLEAGRRLEIDAIIGAVAELARSVRVETPAIDMVLGLIRQKARLLGLDGPSEREAA